MKNKQLRIFLIGIIVVTILGIVGYLILTINKQKENIDSILKCEQLLQIKRQRYFGEKIGNIHTIWNKKLKACLALNIFFDARQYLLGTNNDYEYNVLIINMINDKPLLHYNNIRENGNITIYKDDNFFENVDILTAGKYDEEVLKQVKLYGFNY